MSTETGSPAASGESTEGSWDLSDLIDLESAGLEAAGSLTGDDSLKNEGKVDRAAGETKQKVGDAASKVGDAVGGIADRLKRKD